MEELSLAHVSIPSYWKTLPQRYCLIGMRCKNCGAINFPAREICISCKRKSEFKPKKLSGRGKIYSYTVIAAGSAPPEFSEQEKLAGSFPVAIIELEEGLRIVAQITDYEQEDLKIEAEVEAVFRKIYEEDKVIRYGLKFRPVKKRKSLS
jgi:uncharacterized OB-fold protein